MSAVTETSDLIVDPDLIELIESILASRAELSPLVDRAFDSELWLELDTAGLSRLTGEGDFGSGASWLESAELIRAIARRGVLLPIAENDLLAGWLAQEAGLDDAAHLRTSGIAEADGTIRGLPWAREAQSAIVLQAHDGRWYVREVVIDGESVTRNGNLAGEPRDVLDVGLVGDGAVEVSESIIREWRLRGALARAVQISGALQRAVEIAVQYSTERIQFGRPIAAFQAVQHLVADMASEAALVLAATDNAVRTAVEVEDWSDPQVEFDIAVAKSCASAASAKVTRAAHQVLGAIGTTAEHPLHTVTLPALAWAGEFGSASEWNTRIVEMVAGASRGSSAWELISRVSARR